MRLTHIRWDQPRAKRHRCSAARAHLGNLHRHRTNPRLNLALQRVTASNYRLKTGFGMLVIILRHKLVYFGLNRRCDQLLGSVSNQVRERVFKKFSIIKINYFILILSGVPFWFFVYVVNLQVNQIRHFFSTPHALLLIITQISRIH